MNANEVTRVDDCRLALGAARWDFAQSNAREIDAHWEKRLKDCPHFFNGTIILMEDYSIEDGILHGRFLKTDFKSLLYWREHGFGDAGVIDAFGSALLRSAEGHVVIGRQRAGHVNGGLAYLPGGFIDGRDVSDNGSIDIEANIGRELNEETGLATAELHRVPGYYLTALDGGLSIAAEYRSSLSSEHLRARIEAHIASEDDPELDEAIVVPPDLDLSAIGLAPYAFVLLKALLAHS
jgi:NUDIX domain